MNLSLNGHTALVCGSSQGIGKEIAILFAEMGADIILVARNEQALKEVQSGLANSGNQIHKSIAADFSNPEEAFEIIRSAIPEGTKIDILVNNTGGPAPGPASEAGIDEYIDGFRRHLLMSQLLVLHCLPSMKGLNYGRIINIISVSVRQPIENLGVSNTIRGAMASWSKTLSKELAQFGITVNNILPGYTKTSRLDNLISLRAKTAGISFEEMESTIVSAIPAKRLGNPRETAFLAGFLASEQAAYINGTSIPIDGAYLSSI
jgi:3-oxoacyl-[acyl-carrier protein] reductase